MRNASSKASPWERRIVLVGCVVACCTLALHCRSKPSDGPGGGPDARAGGRAIEPGAPLGQVADERQENEEGGRGARSANDERTMGARSAEDVDRMAGVAGPKDNPNPHMARTVMREAPGAGAAGPRDNPNPHMARTVMREAPGADGSAPAIAHGFATRSGGGSGVGFSRGAVRRTSRSSRGRGDDCGRNATPFDCPDVDEFLIVEAPEPARESDPGEPPPPTQGTLRAKNAEGEEAGDFPLEHTEVTSEVSGMIARTTVEQIYGNPFSEVIEAVYVFPLPALGAVNDFVMQVGDRKIVGLIRPRAEAERIYAEARAAGHTASLLTQERSNIFTQSVANIEPGGKVTIEITYFERLVYESGYYEWVFPMVVGPRYIPGEPTTPASDDPDAPSSAGGGTSPSTTQVGDADRITPPVLPPDRRSGHDISLTVTLDAGLPIARLAVPTHQVETQDLGAGKRVVKLAAADTIPNRDLVLRWSVAGAETQFGVLAHRGDAGGYLTLVMQPPAEPTDEQVVPREITFLIDISGSMSGVPLGIAAAVVRETLDRLRPDDRYNIVVFAGGNGQLWESARPKTDGNVAAARGYIEELCGGGGTEMLEGVRHALKAEHDPAALQMYVFLTDGLVGNEMRSSSWSRTSAAKPGSSCSASLQRQPVPRGRHRRVRRRGLRRRPPTRRGGRLPGHAPAVRDDRFPVLVDGTTGTACPSPTPTRPGSPTSSLARPCPSSHASRAPAAEPPTSPAASAPAASATPSPSCCPSARRPMPRWRPCGPAGGSRTCPSC